MHTPVLLHEVIELLDPKPGAFIIDGTFGGGGHSKMILEKIGPQGKLLAIDLEEAAILKNGEEVCELPNMICVHSNFAKLPEVLKEQHLPLADGLLLDLGFSSNQIENSGKGFSFQKDELLIMTYNDADEPVYKLLARLPEEEIERVIQEYGEERYARKIAQAIVARRASGRFVKTSKELAELVQKVVPNNYEHGRIHPATRTFQAFRIYANHELENVNTVLRQLNQIIKSGGRVAIISFHSLEDRLVKHSLREAKKEGRVELVTKKSVRPSLEEVKSNPRARSAKLRVAIII
ncbi:MAG TPA: 16S rRNA (cytosine(1402)-N(4))-methyltransferase RsmH [Candidatus Paceibacterota bacterium]